MAEFEAGVAFVSLLPEARGFSKKAKRALAEIGELNKDVELDAKADKLHAAIKQVKGELAALEREKTNPSIQLDTAVAEARLTELRDRLKELQKGKVDPKVEVDLVRAQAEVDKFTAKLEALGKKKATPKVTADIAAAQVQLDQANAKLDALNQKKANPKIDAVGIAEAQRDIAKVEAQLAALNARKASVNVDAEIAEGMAQLAAFEAKLAEIERAKAEPKVTADTTQATARLAELDARLRDLASRKSTPEVELQIAQAQQQALRIRAELDRLGSERVSAQVDADIALASAQLARINQQLSAIDNKRVNARVDASSSGRASLILMGVVAALGAVAAAAPAAIAALAAVGGAAGALGQGITAGIAGFSGIGDALKALEADEKSAATSSASSSSTRSNAAKQVESAQRSLGQAQVQADRAAITGAQQVASAQQSLGQARLQQSRTAVQGAQQVADAERALGQAVQQAARARISADQQVAAARRAVSDAITSANQRVASAERSLESAQRGRQSAQEALTRAVEDATRANRDLQLSVSGAALSEERATLSLAQARDRLAKSTSTDPLERADLSLAVREAEQNLKEVQTRYGDLRQEQGQWAATGVMGSKQVVDATRGVADAQRSVQDAQQGLVDAQVSGARQVSDAQESLARAQQSAAWSVADAQQGVVRAQEAVQRASVSAAQANADAATQVAQAQLGVSQAVQQASWSQQDAARQVEDAQRALAEAYTAGGESAAAGSKQAEYALSKLTPAGRSLVSFLKSEFQPAWKRVTDSVANEMLPKVESALRNSLKLEPTITAGLTEAGRVLGDLAVRGSELATSPPFMASFAGIMASNNRALGDYGNAGINLFGAFTDLYAVAGPVAERFSRLADYSTQAFESWVIGARQTGELDRYLQSAADSLQYVGGWIMDVSGDVIQFTMSFAPLGVALLEGVRYATDFIATISSWSPTLTSIVGGLGLAAIAMSKLGNATKALSVAGAAGGIGGLASSVRTLLTPSLLAATGPMVALGSSGAIAGGKLGEMAGKVTGSTTAIATGSAAGAKFTGVLTKTASTLPLVGTAIVGVVLAHDALTTSSSEAAEALLKGGSAAASMRAELAENDATMARNRSWMPGWLADLEEWNRGTFGLQTTTQQANEELEKQISTMSPLEAAQARVTLAQNNYEAALRESGPTSQRTRDAQAALATASGDVAREQDNARRATMTATQALQDQQTKILSAIDARLGEQSAVQATKDAQKALGDAIAQSGPKSDEAAAAQTRLEQAQSSQAQAAMRAAAEEAKRRGETDTSRASTDALGRSVRDMVMSSQGELTPALQQMVQGLDAAGLSAAGATVKIDGAGRAVAVFPNGKTVLLDANTSPALAGLDGVALKLNSVPGNKTVTVGTLSAEAEAKLSAIGFTVTHLPNGQVQVTANDAMARGTLIAFQQFAAWQQANPQLAADPAKSYEAMRGFLINAGQQTGVPMLDANPQRADQQVRDAVGRYNTTWSTMPVTSNPSEADRKAGEARGRAGAPVAFGLSANPDYQGITGFFNWLGDMISGAAGGFAHIFGSGGMNEVRRAMGLPPVANGGPIYPRAVGGLVGYAAGGLLRGPGTGTSDSILGLDRGGMPTAMVSNGEYVIRAAAVRELGVGTLNQINAVGGRTRGGLVGLAAGGMAKPEPMDAAASAGAPAMAVPSGDPAATGAAASATSALASSMGSAASQAQTLNPALAALATTQATMLAPATAAVTAGQQALVTGGILPLVGTMLSSLFPTLGLYQQQMGVAAPAANTALQTSQLATQAQTTATALNTAVNSGLMNAAVTGMSLTGQAQHAALRGTQLATQASNAQTATSTAVNSQNMAISTTNMSLIGQQQHGNLRLSQGLTQAQTTATALNTAANNANMIATTGNMSATNQGHLGFLRGGLDTTKMSVQGTADWWRGQMGRMVPDSANPIRWILQFPMRSIVDAWNNLDRQFALGKPVAPVMPGFATGGQISGPGSGTSDSIMARLSDGEFVVRESVASRVPNFLNALNSGQPEAIQAAGGVRASMPGFAAGGMIAAQQFAQAQNGKPYIWGGVGPAGYDCSGFMSAITNVLRGQNPHRRLGVARSQPWSGFRPGLNGAFATGFSATHTAGTLGGVNVEAGGSPSRTKYRAQAAGADSPQFRGHATLPEVGGVFASGGAGGGASIDPTPIVEAAFAKAYKEIADVPKFFGPSDQVARNQGVARAGADGVKAKALAKLQEMFASAALGPLGAGAPFYVGEISRAAKTRGLGVDGATIGVATALVESGLRMYANAKVPGSLRLPHDAVGSDHDSVGLFQQRQAGWGSLEQRMNAFASAGMFFDRLMRFNWRAMDPGAAAQRVQVSAFPGRYSGRMGQARGLVGQFGGQFDNGGLLSPGLTMAMNNTGAPERILDNVETRNYDTLTRLMGRGGVKVDSPAYGGAQQGAVIHVHPREMQSEQKIALGVKREFDWESRLA